MFLRRALFLSIAFVLFLAVPGFAYEVPQVCMDAYELEKTSPPDLSRVIQLYTQCLQGNLSPSNRSIILNNRGNARYNKGDLDGAITDYSKAISLNPKYAPAYNNHGLTRYDKGDLDGAIADYSKAISLNPKYAEAYNNRGNARDDKGDFDGAIVDYNKAISLNPKYALAYGNRAFIYKDNGDIAKAKADAKKARELDPKVKVPTFE